MTVPENIGLHRIQTSILGLLHQPFPHLHITQQRNPSARRKMAEIGPLASEEEGREIHTSGVLLG